MPSPPTRQLDYFNAFLSYLIPGLGQVMQGRIAKGLLYFVALYSLFFYGMYLGHWKNVWLPKCSNLPDQNVPIINAAPGGVFKDLFYRKEFAGQFWMGVATWPALVQYLYTDPQPAGDKDGRGFNAEKEAWQPKPHALLGTYMQTPPERVVNDLQRNGDKRWDLGWVYTVIAGVLNILVIYDAFAGPVVRSPEDEKKKQAAAANSVAIAGGAR
jgi:hypothetical protein